MKKAAMSPASPAAPTTIDEYIAAVAPEVRPVLERIRATIRKAAPTAVETVSYRMASFTLHGAFVYFGAFKEHIGFFPPVQDEALKLAAAKYMGPKGNLRFPLNKPMPYALIGKLVKARARANEARLLARSSKASGKSTASVTNKPRRT